MKVLAIVFLCVVYSSNSYAGKDGPDRKTGGVFGKIIHFFSPQAEKEPIDAEAIPVNNPEKELKEQEPKEQKDIEQNLTSHTEPRKIEELEPENSDSESIIVDPKLIKHEEEELRKKRENDERELKKRQEKLKRLKKLEDQSWTEFRNSLEYTDQSGFSPYRDRLALRWFMQQSATFRHKGVFLAIGSPFKGKLTYEEYYQFKKLVAQLRKKHYKIIYDADSSISDLVESNVASSQRLGISGNLARQSKDVLVIENPYFRLNLLLLSSKIIMSPDSILGLGLLLEGHNQSQNKFLIFDPEERWSSGLSNWKQYLEGQHYVDDPTIEASQVASEGGRPLDEDDPFYPSKHKRWTKKLGKEVVAPVAHAIKEIWKDRVLIGQSETQWSYPQRSHKGPINLGVNYSYYNRPKSFRRVSDLISELEHDQQYSHSVYRNGAESRYLQPIERVDFLGVLNGMSGEELIQERQSVVHYKSVFYDLEKAEERFLPSQKAVVFGSGKGSKRYEGIVSEFIKQVAEHDLVIRTGGAGGFMELANITAFSNGAFSVGIPIVGSQSLESERRIAREFQDLTLETLGYHERIPLLLHHCKNIYLAPGGTGTMKELAAAFVKAADGVLEFPDLVFLGREYYLPLLDWFGTLGLPEKIRKNIYVLDTFEDAQSVNDLQHFSQKNQDN